MGAARGKLILIQRFTYKFLPINANPFGLHLPREKWTSNGREIKILYGDDNSNQLAHIQVRITHRLFPR